MHESKCETNCCGVSSSEVSRQATNIAGEAVPVTGSCFPLWTERCSSLSAGQAHEHLHEKRMRAFASKASGAMLRPEKGRGRRPVIRWLLDNGSTAHMADEATLLPYCFNIRRESTVVRAIYDREVSTSTKRADCLLDFPTLGMGGEKMGLLFRDIVLLPRKQQDVEKCSTSSCPKNYPEEGRPVFIACQHRLLEDGVGFVYAGERATASLGGRAMRIHLEGRLSYLEGGQPSGSHSDPGDRRDVQVPAYHVDIWHGRTHASLPVLGLTEASTTGMRIGKKSTLSSCVHCQEANFRTWENT